MLVFGVVGLAHIRVFVYCLLFVWIGGGTYTARVIGTIVSTVDCGSNRQA